MDELDRALRDIRRSQAMVRQRDTFGRYETDAPRTRAFNVRLSEGEYDMLRSVAVEAGMTMTHMILAAVRYYATLME